MLLEGVLLLVLLLGDVELVAAVVESLSGDSGVVAVTPAPDCARERSVSVSVDRSDDEAEVDGVEIDDGPLEVDGELVLDDELEGDDLDVEAEELEEVCACNANVVAKSAAVVDAISLS